MATNKTSTLCGPATAGAGGDHEKSIDFVLCGGDCRGIVFD